MSSLAALALALDNSRLLDHQQYEDLSTHGTTSKRYVSSKWSAYFVQNTSKNRKAIEFHLQDLVVDCIPDKISFSQKKLLHLRKLVSSELLDANDVGLEDDRVNWEIVSQKLSSDSQVYSARDCYMQYNNVDSKEINRDVWEADEDRKLLALANTFEECGWVKIADELGTKRTPLQCLQRYQQALNSKLVDSSEWTREEDDMLRKAVEIHGTKNWQNVASIILGRSAVQCGARYRKSSKSRNDIVDGSWTDIDERKLFLASVAYEIPTSSIFKKTTSEIDAFVAALENDPTASVKSILALNNDSQDVTDVPITSKNPEVQRREKKKYNLTKAIHSTTPGGEGLPPVRQSQLWAAVAKLVPGKNDERCREKWVNSLDPTLLFGPFTPQEYMLLKKLVEDSGAGNWAEKSLWFPGRTDANLMARWKTGCMSALAERKTYKAQAKLRKIIAVPALSRGSVALSCLSEKDYTPVLTADLALYSHGSASLEHNETVTGVQGHDDGDGDCGGDGAIDNEDPEHRTNASDSHHYSVNSGENSNNGRSSGSLSSEMIIAAEDDYLPVPLAVTFCSVCEVQVLPEGSDDYQSIIICAVCNSHFHWSCCFSDCSSDPARGVCRRVDPSNFDCRVCRIIAVTTDQSKSKGTRYVNHLKAKRKNSESNANDVDDNLESPKKLTKKRKVASKKITTAAPKAHVQSKQRLEESAIHPDILAALEACESYELT